MTNSPKSTELQAAFSDALVRGLAAAADAPYDQVAAGLDEAARSAEALAVMDDAFAEWERTPAYERAAAWALYGPETRGALADAFRAGYAAALRRDAIAARFTTPNAVRAENEAAWRELPKGLTDER